LSNQNLSKKDLNYKSAQAHYSAQTPDYAIGNSGPLVWKPTFEKEIDDLIDQELNEDPTRLSYLKQGFDDSVDQVVVDLQD